MIRAAISFFIIAVISYILGAYGIAGVSVEIGKVLLFVFLVLSAISFLYSVISGKTPRQLH